MSSINICPRYTPGSPTGCASWELGVKVAQEERHAIEAELEGFYGEEHQARAKRLGLHRIVYEATEKRGTWAVLDLLTRERYVRPAKLERHAKIEVWTDDEGWVPHYAWEPMKKDAGSVEVRRSDKEVWETKPWIARRDLIRDPHSVRKLDREEWKREMWSEWLPWPAEVVHFAMFECQSRDEHRNDDSHDDTSVVEKVTCPECRAVMVKKEGKA